MRKELCSVSIYVSSCSQILLSLPHPERTPWNMTDSTVTVWYCVCVCERERACARGSMIALEVLWGPRGSECSCAGWLVVTWNTVGRILRGFSDSAEKSSVIRSPCLSRCAGLENESTNAACGWLTVAQWKHLFYSWGHEAQSISVICRRVVVSRRAGTVITKPPDS